MKSKIFVPIAVLFLLSFGIPANASRVDLARDGRSQYRIVVMGGGETAHYAAEELSTFLNRMSGARFEVTDRSVGARNIVLRLRPENGYPDGYSISVEGHDVRLEGSSERGLLYAVYDLLERLGCRFLAPEFAFYGDAATHVPEARNLVLNLDTPVTAQPVFTHRKLYVEEGLSHTAENLQQLVAWMPRARFNTLVVPMDYQNTGRVRWDAWREALTPELRKRGIAIEVGGHGYQNFLNASMQEGDLFRAHPDWFGLGTDCKPSEAGHVVFNTEHPGAVAFLARNIASYLKERPEIDIFDFWPPDGARWAECASREVIGTPEDRQARLAKEVLRQVKAVRPDVRFELIAYAHAKNPPQTETLDPAIILDFCPIGQSFDVPIFGLGSANNATYKKLLEDWRLRFKGDIGLYSYYRKYAWKSLPVVLTRYMQQDLRWYASLPLQGISTYAEPGDWRTYETNHYILARLAWDPDVNVDTLLEDFARHRYGVHARPAVEALRALEQTVPRYGSIPYSERRPVAEILAARDTLRAMRGRLRTTKAMALAPLCHMLRYAELDLELVAAVLSGTTDDELKIHVEPLVEHLQAHAADGLFIVRGKDVAGATVRRYRSVAKARTDD